MIVNTGIQPISRLQAFPALDWATASGLTKRQAEDLLDWLEATGCDEHELIWDHQRQFVVRWRRLARQNY